MLRLEAVEIVAARCERDFVKLKMREPYVQSEGGIMTQKSIASFHQMKTGIRR